MEAVLWYTAFEGLDAITRRVAEIGGKAAECTVSIPSLGTEFTVAMGPQQIRTFRLPQGGGAPQECLLTEYPDNAG